MHSKWVFKHFHRRPGNRIPLLLALWFTGLLIGILLCNSRAFDCAAVLRCAVAEMPSPIGLLLVCLLPVALTAIAVCSPLIGILYLTVVLNAISHGFCGTVIYIALGSAAWLLRPMLLFTSCCTSALMWWLILQNEGQNRNRKNIRTAGIVSGIVFIVDLFVVSPLVDNVSKYF